MDDREIAAAVRVLGRRDRKLARLIRKHGPPPLRRTRNALESLGRAIVYQQLSGKAAATIYRRFLDLYPRGRFPTAAQLARTDVGRLRSVGLSRQKASYLLDLAAKFDAKLVSPRRFSRQSESELRTELKQVKGIGDWSVDMFLIFGLVRPDVLPTGDLGVQKGMAVHFGLPSLPKPDAMIELAEPWRPYRSLAAWYMWRHLED